jgi:hypothetical protein
LGVFGQFGLLLFIGQGEKNLTVFVKKVSRGFSNGLEGRSGIFGTGRLRLTTIADPIQPALFFSTTYFRIWMKRSKIAALLGGSQCQSRVSIMLSLD